MKHTLFTALAALLVTAFPAMAQQGQAPSTNVAWTIDTLNLVRSGNAEEGARLNSDLACASCHGDSGQSSNDAWPSLSGQRPGYIFKVLKDYQDGKLSGTSRGQLMAYVVEEMTDQNMADLAAFFAANALPPAREGTAPDMAEGLDLLGDPKRLIPPCSACHGTRAQGDFPDYPALAGQSPEFLARALEDFRTGRRSNDVYSRMRLISARLTDEEIAALATYFSTRGTTAPDGE